MIRKTAAIPLCLVLLLAFGLFSGCGRKGETAVRFDEISAVWGTILAEEAIQRSPQPGTIFVIKAEAAEEDDAVSPSGADRMLEGIRQRITEAAGYRVQLVTFTNDMGIFFSDELPGIPPDVMDMFNTANTSIVACISLAGPPRFRFARADIPLILFSYNVKEAEAWIAADRASAAVIERPYTPSKPLEQATRDLYFETLDQTHETHQSF